MLAFIIALLGRVNTVLTRLTSTRAGNLDYLDEAISGISPVRSIQHGSIAISNGASSNTATITAVTTAKTQLTLLGARYGGTVTAFTDAGVALTLTNSTTITAERNGTTGTITVRFCATEFK